MGRAVVCAVVVVLAVAVAGPAWAARGAGVRGPVGITTGPDKALWFTNPSENTIGRITTDGTLVTFRDKTFSTPWLITTGPDGALWFTNRGNDTIGRITTDGKVTSFSGDGIREPVGITTGPDGALWFTNYRNHTIGRITTAGIVTVYHGKDISRPITITTGPDGALWFTNPGSNTIGRITVDGTVSSMQDSAISGPRGITLGPDGSLWITNQTNHTIARITSDGAVRSSPVSGVPFALATGSDKSLWVTLPTTAAIARVNADGTVHTETSADVSRPLDIGSGPDGALWFTNGGTSGWIGRITLGGVVRAFLRDEIAYQGGGRLWLINADGSGQRMITAGVADRSLAWSLDGRWIAFTAGQELTRGPEDKSSIKIVSADGTQERLLTAEPGGTAREPMWSPDGKWIVYEGWTSENGSWELYVINSEGGVARQLTHGGSPEFGHWAADWSPDGHWIVFEDDSGVMHPMLKIHPDGTGLREIGSYPASDHCLCADWSPDGSKITFQADASAAPSDANLPEIFVMNADGSGRVQLTRNSTLDENPDWSPDGTRIAFYSERVGNAEIYVINADGSHVTRVTHDPWYSQLPRWRPR